MNFQDKTKEELLAELLKLQQENQALRQAIEKNPENTSGRAFSPRGDDAYNLATLRQKAEDLQSREQLKPDENLAQTDAAKLMHEFQVHQIELEMQAEEMQWAKSAALDAIELYDFAPMAYFTLTQTGEVIRLNLSGAAMLGKERSQLQNCEFTNFISVDSKPTFNLFLNNVFKGINKESCEVVVYADDHVPSYVFITGIITESRKTCLMTAFDITGRKQAEEAILRSEEKFRSLYIHMIEGAALHNLVYNEQGVPEDYLIVEVNPAFEVQLGINRETVINKTSKAAYGVDDPPFFDVYTRVALTGKPEVFETYFAPLDKYFSISVYRPYPGSFATVFENISERRKAEDALRISEDKFKNLVTNMPVGVLLQGPDSGMILSNSKALELLGITEDQLLGRTSFDPSWNVIHEDGSPFPGNTHPVPQSIATRLPVRSVIMGVYRPSAGDRAWLLVDALPQLNNDGTVNHVICTFIDVSKRILAENENERIQKLLEDSQSIGKIGGWEFNIDTRKLTWTREMYAIHEVDQTFIPMADQEARFYTPESLPAIDAAVQRAFEYGESFEVDSEIITAKGNRRSVKSIGKADLKNRRIYGLFQDITERKLAEKELLETNSYLENLINYANAPIIVWDPHFNITRFNHAFEALTGRTEAEVLGQPLEILFPSVLAGKSMSLIRKTLTGERWETVEIEIQHRDKTSRTVLWNSATLFEPDGKTPLATIAQGQDISERKQVETELRKSREAFKEYFEMGSIGMCITSPEKGWLEVNERLCQMMGYTKEELSQHTWSELTHADDLDADVELFNQVIAGKRNSYSIDKRFLRKDGSTIYTTLSVSCQRNTDGTVNHMLASLLDITERKQAEEELLKTNSYLENLINYANAPIIVWDPHFNITRFNHAFETLTGFNEAEVLGQSLEILFPPALAGKSMSLIRKTLSGEHWETVEIEIQHRDKTSRTVLWNSATLFAPDGKTPLATIAQGQDITRRKQAEEESKRKNLELEKINSEKDKFFSIIAHDLRGPFNGFLGLTQLMSEEISSLTLKELQDISSGLNVSANNLYNLLNNLLEWSRMQQGATSFEPKSVSLLPFATSTLQLMMDSSGKKGIALNIHIPENIYVFADEKMLASTIRNLVSNAVKYTRAGGSVSISANYAPDNHVVITVKDTGIGMDTKILANMFRLDTSISRKGTDGEPSTGLGLLLCKDFIEKHGGKIWAESEVKKGSTFYFTVPVGHSDLS